MGDGKKDRDWTTLRLSMLFFNIEEDPDPAIHAIKRELSGRAATAA